MTRKNADWTISAIEAARRMLRGDAGVDLVRELAPHPLKSIISKANRHGIKRNRRLLEIAKAHVPTFTFKRKVEVSE
jgi:hypothetical protein